MSEKPNEWQLTELQKRAWEYNTTGSVPKVPDNKTEKKENKSKSEFQEKLKEQGVEWNPEHLK
jgi:hypothetical protein